MWQPASNMAELPWWSEVPAPEDRHKRTTKALGSRVIRGF